MLDIIVVIIVLLQYNFVAVMYQEEMLRLLRQLGARAMRRLLDISCDGDENAQWLAMSADKKNDIPLEKPESNYVDVCFASQLLIGLLPSV